MNIVIPMAGEGQRFKDAGYTEYKAFLPVGNKRMIDAVIENVTPTKNAWFTFVTRYHGLMSSSLPNGSFIKELSKPTDGAVSTILEVRDYIDDNSPLLIVNSDQIVDFDIDDFLVVAQEYEGLILTFPSKEPKWSYAKVKNGEVISVAEKVPISNHATCGIYYFSSGHDFLEAADQMLAKAIKTKGEYYLCPVYNELIAMGKRVGIYEVAKEAMHGLGTPEDYEAYQSNLI